MAEKLVPYLESLYPERSNLSVTDLEEINMCWETELYTLEVNSMKNGDPIKEHRVLRVFQGDNVRRKSAKEYYLMRKLFDVGYPVPQVYRYDVSREAIGKPFILIERILVLVRTL